MYQIISCTLVVILHVCITTGEYLKYIHYDLMTPHLVLHCDQCPPGTYVKQDCTAERNTECAPCPSNHFADQWNSDKECQFCSAVCKELQYVRQECNGTTARICECSEGHFLDMEFCIPHKECPPGFGVVQQGTPESDVVCAECLQGTFSNVTSAMAPCWKHTNCKKSGLKVAQKGSSTADTVCEEQSKLCETDVSLCEEALLHFPRAPFNWSDILLQRLHPPALMTQQIQAIKQIYEPKEQPLQLFKLYKSQHKGEESLKHLKQGLKGCEKRVIKLFGHLAVKEKHLQILMQSLPGKPVGKEDIKKTLKACDPPRQIPKLLNLWRIKNGGNTMVGLKQLTTSQLPKSLRRAMKKLEQFLNGITIYRLYGKLMQEVSGAQVQLVKEDSVL
ncbi:tumor necrosis factor receptor superfamily member 11B [Gastrophryne carolinensis]